MEALNIVYPGGSHLKSSPRFITALGPPGGLQGFSEWLAMVFAMNSGLVFINSKCI